MTGYGKSLSVSLRQVFAEVLLIVAGTLFFFGLAATLGLPGEDSTHETPTALAEGDRFAR